MWTAKLDYGVWATQRLIDTLISDSFLDVSIEEPIQLLSHIENATEIWYRRVNEPDYVVEGVWDIDSLDGCLKRSRASAAQWKELLDTSSPGNMIEYQNWKGKKQLSKLEDIAIHVVNHGTHHRGQVSTWIRRHDVTPPPIDYIFFTREQG